MPLKPVDFAVPDTEDFKKRFWEKVDKNGPEIIQGSPCWVWTSNRKGGDEFKYDYGQFWCDGKMRLAHRISYYLANGKFPDEEKPFVCHRCDNTVCVRPDHLYSGTHRENMIECSMRGRKNSKRGEENGNSKLNEEIVREIRKVYDGGGVNFSKLAEMFEVDRVTATLIARRQSWKHVT